MEERHDTDIEIEATATEDALIEDTELEDEDIRSGDKLRRMRDKLKLTEQEKMTALEDLARARADFLNARKRLEEERVSDKERAKLQFVEDILPLADSFSLALADPAFQELPANLQKGVLGINAQLSSVLKNYNVSEVGNVGEQFDPNIHEALDHQDGGDIVSGVIQKGYKIGEKIIRPARVTVGK